MKDLLILGGMAAGAVFIGSFLFFTEANIAQPVQNKIAQTHVKNEASVVTSVIMGGAYAPIKERVNYLIDNKNDLNKLWKKLFGTGTSVPEKPKIDFSENKIMAIFAGTEPTGGYSITVSNVRDLLNKRVVSIVITKPDKSCIVAQSQTSPYQIIKISSTTLPFTHNDTTTTHLCN